jgi:hypothetical protein
LEQIQKKKSNRYWTKETESNIKLYILEKDYIKKNKIFDNSLHKPLNKLIENIIHKYKLWNFDNTGLEDIKQQVLCHIIENISKFDVTRGTKAYSYIGTVAKNFLIQKQIYYQKIKNISINGMDDYNDSNGDSEFAGNSGRGDNNVFNSIKHSYVIDDDNLMKSLLKEFIKDLDKTIQLPAKEKEIVEWKTFLNSFILICQMNDGLGFLENKPTFFNSLRTINNFSANKNYQYMNRLKEAYFEFKKNYLNKEYNKTVQNIRFVDDILENDYIEESILPLDPDIEDIFNEEGVF